MVGPGSPEGPEKIKSKYNICEDKLLYFGYSCGAQCSNLFPAWKPTICRAWVSHASGVWHKPNSAMRNSPGVVTCGDADARRYILSRNSSRNRAKRSFDYLEDFSERSALGSARVIKLAQTFLEFQHQDHKDDLTPGLSFRRSYVINKQKKYIGDDQEGRFWPAESELRIIFLRLTGSYYPTLNSLWLGEAVGRDKG